MSSQCPTESSRYLTYQVCAYDEFGYVYVPALTFLRLNGFSFRPDTIEGVKMMEDLASGDVSEEGFAAWMSSGMYPI